MGVEEEAEAGREGEGRKDKRQVWRRKGAGRAAGGREQAVRSIGAAGPVRPPDATKRLTLPKRFQC